MELAGEDSISEILLQTNSMKEATAATSHSEKLSGGLASRGNTSSKPWQGDKLARGGDKLVQVDHLCKSITGSSLVQVDNCDKRSALESVVQVDNCYVKAPTNNVVH